MINRRTFLLGAGVGITSGCNRLRTSTPGNNKPITVPMVYSTVRMGSGFFGAIEPLLSVVGANGAITEILSYGVNETKTSSPQGVAGAMAVQVTPVPITGPLSNAGTELRVALLSDGGIAFLSGLGGKATIFDAKSVEGAFGGHRIRQVEGDRALLADGTVEHNFGRRIGTPPTKLTLVEMAANKKVLGGVKRLKAGMAFCENGDAYLAGGDYAYFETEGPLIKERIADRTWLPDSLRMGPAVLTQDGKLFVNTQILPPEWTLLECPADARRIQATGYSIVVLTAGGEVWRIGLKGVIDKKPVKLGEINDAAFVAAEPLNDIAILRKDGSVWVTNPSHWPDVKPVKVSDGVMLPDAEV